MNEMTLTIFMMVFLMKTMMMMKGSGHTQLSAGKPEIDNSVSCQRLLIIIMMVIMVIVVMLVMMIIILIIIFIIVIMIVIIIVIQKGSFDSIDRGFNEV